MTQGNRGFCGRPRQSRTCGSIAVATELFFNEGMPQKVHWIMRRFWLNLTLVHLLYNLSYKTRSVLFWAGLLCIDGDLKVQF